MSNRTTFQILRVFIAAMLACNSIVVVAAELTIIKGDPKRPYQQLGTFKHWECKSGPSDPWPNVEVRSFRELTKIATDYSNRSKIDAVVNVECTHRFDGKLIKGCDEAVRCVGDYVSWK